MFCLYSFVYSGPHGKWLEAVSSPVPVYRNKEMYCNIVYLSTILLHWREVNIGQDFVFTKANN